MSVQGADGIGLTVVICPIIENGKWMGLKEEENERYIKSRMDRRHYENLALALISSH